MSKEDAKVWYLLGEGFWGEQGCTQSGLLSLCCSWGMVRVRDPTQKLGLTLLLAQGGSIQAFLRLCRFWAGGGGLRLDNCQRSNVKNRVRLFFFNYEEEFRED